MILINLLPSEHRAKRRTPLKMMAAVALSVAVNASLFAWWAWTAFGVAAEVESELAVLGDTMQALEPQMSYHDTLEKEAKLFQSRQATLDDITGTRISWTEKMDQLIDLVHQGGNGSEKYLVWFDGLTVDASKNERKKTFGSVTANGFSGSREISQVANFMDDVVDSALAKDFLVVSNPQGNEAKVDITLDPSEVWQFPFEMAMRSPEERGLAKAATPAAKAPAKTDKGEKEAGK